MTSAELSSNNPQKAVKTHMFRRTFLQELKQNVPFILAFSIISIFVLFLPQLVLLINDNIHLENMGNASEYFPRDFYRFGLNVCSVLLMPILAYILGLIQFHYLTNKRAMDVFAALPVKRETAVSARILAGVSILGIPNLICYTALFFVNIGVNGVYGAIVKEYFVVIFFSTVLMLIPYALAVFVATLSGTITENIIYPMVLMISPVLLYLFVTQMLRENLYGFSMGDEIFKRFSFLFPYTILGASDYIEGLTNSLFRSWNADRTFRELLMEMLPQFLLWAFISLALLGVSVLFYRCRKSEIAGKRNASKLLNVIACLATVTLVGMMIFFLASVMGELAYRLRFFFFILGTLIAFIIFQMVILHSVREVFKTYKTYLIALPFYILLIVFVNTNGFGVYNEVPKAEDVKAISINYTGKDIHYHGENLYRSETPEVIDQIIRFQKSVLETRNEEEKEYRQIELSYKMKNGDEIYRTYQRVSAESLQILDELESYSDFKKKNHAVFQKDFLNGVVQMELTDILETRCLPLTFEQFDLQAFQQALQADVLEESHEQMQHPDAPAKGYLNIVYQENDGEPSKGDLHISIKAHYKHTIQYLKEAGLMEYLEPDLSRVEKAVVFTARESGEIRTILNNFFSEMNTTSQMAYVSSYRRDKNLFSDIESELEYWNQEEGFSSQIYENPEDIESVLNRSYNEYFLDSCKAVAVMAVAQEDGTLISKTFVLPDKQS